ncbi:antigen 5 like allergen Cul n 1-like [Drosophila montana]|uniref:antigen 5 like allergen Cul n 1-like n=1 Tax=Drosophila montana TaxID=40370 RepID=UPI00313D6921
MQRQHLLLVSAVILGLARITAMPSSCFYTTGKYTEPDYCEEPSQPHLGCDNAKRWGKKCGEPRSIIKMTFGLRRRIVRQHNVYRNMVAKGNMAGLPVAGRMLTMGWDRVLAGLAELAVMRCEIDPIRMSFSTTYASRPGYNAAFSKYPKNQEQDKRKILDSHLRAWYDQYRYANMKSLRTGKSSGGREISHFLQLMNGENSRVGCAMASFHTGSWKNQLLICLYGCGKRRGEYVYSIGKVPGESCTCGTEKDFRNLCYLESDKVDCSMKRKKEVVEETDDEYDYDYGIFGPSKTTTTTTTKKPKKQCRPGSMGSILDWIFG